MIAVIRDNNADVDIEETENIANSDISDRDRNNKGRRHLLRRCGAAALRRSGFKISSRECRYQLQLCRHKSVITVSCIRNQLLSTIPGST